jgi:hypothetical protein
MPKFKVWEEVRLNTARERATDFLADLQSCLVDRSISGRTYDALVNAIEYRKVFVVVAKEVDAEEFESYEIKMRDGKAKLPCMVTEDDLEGVS